MVKLTIVGTEGLNPRQQNVFNNANYFDCDKFTYTYYSAVNSYNFAHNGSSRNNHFNGKVISPEDWQQLPDDESLNGEYCHVTTVSIPLNYRIEDGELILAENDD